LDKKHDNLEVFAISEQVLASDF